MPDVPFRAGFVAVVGRPNTGKSTLVNALVREKISIVTSKPQTTRHSILGILSEPSYQVILVDTPGLHRDGGKLINRVMNRAATSSLADADLILFVVEATGWKEGDNRVIEKLVRAGRRIILVINKLDLKKRHADLLPIIQDFSERGSFEEIIPISARNEKNLDRLMEIVVSRLPESEELYPVDMKTNRSFEFRTGEVLREKLLEALREEIPYGLAVEILAMEERDSMQFVDAIIWVEKESHRGIVVGHAGDKIKRVSTAARLELESIFGRHFYLKAQVKVKDNWRDSAAALRQLGYEATQ
jgi:GTP-binding protein Era